MLYHHYGKRLFDLVVSTCLLLILSPLLFLIAILVRINLGNPVIFKQFRSRQFEKPFTLYKFRSMIDARDSQGNFLPDNKRLTSFGKFLRGTSLDELPELINVLRGEMSLVGPRPLLVNYLERYSPEQSRRHEVKPGITGWAQVNGRNAISWQERFLLDVWYIDHLTFGLDLRILTLTVVSVVMRKDINQPGEATIEEFFGNKGNV